MKSARERAVDVWFSLPTDAKLAIIHGEGGEGAWLEKTALSFKEHARDQQNIDAVAARDALVNFRHARDAYAAVMDAPAPGE